MRGANMNLLVSLLNCKCLLITEKITLLIFHVCTVCLFRTGLFIEFGQFQATKLGVRHSGSLNAFLQHKDFLNEPREYQCEASSLS